MSAVGRVGRALILANMTIAELERALFMRNDTVRYALDWLMQCGIVNRELDKHDKSTTGRPAYRYSLIAPNTAAARASHLAKMVGDWDAGAA